MAAELAADAERDFSSLQRRRPEIDARLMKMGQAERDEFQAELRRLLKRHEITKSQPSFRRGWKSAKD
ncbi:hypothetical protein WOC76_04330 [Methylocystis sp. IM3]|uniref:hypothetical protein n=1 Tax=unclassified Methylocystis TaxID=2625913 RepID=UPI0030F5AC03